MLPQMETGIPNDLCSPTWETHIPSDKHDNFTLFIAISLSAETWKIVTKNVCQFFLLKLTF